MEQKEHQHKEMGRRKFLKLLGTGAAATSAALYGCGTKSGSSVSGTGAGEVPEGGMTMRDNPTSGDKVSLLGFGMMRLPFTKDGGKDVIDQEFVNELVDYAMAHGVNEGNIPVSSQDKNYREARRAYLIGYDRSVPKLRQASHCIGCNQCSPHCPQSIDIPKELHRIDEYVEKLKQNTL